MSGLQSRRGLIGDHKEAGELEVNPERSESRSDASAGFSSSSEPRLFTGEAAKTELFQDRNGSFYLVPVDPSSLMDCESCQ